MSGWYADVHDHGEPDTDGECGIESGSVQRDGNGSHCIFGRGDGHGVQLDEQCSWDWPGCERDRQHRFVYGGEHGQCSGGSDDHGDAVLYEWRHDVHGQRDHVYDHSEPDAGCESGCQSGGLQRQFDGCSGIREQCCGHDVHVDEQQYKHRPCGERFRRHCVVHSGERDPGTCGSDDHGDSVVYGYCGDLHGQFDHVYDHGEPDADGEPASESVGVQREQHGSGDVHGDGDWDGVQLDK